jgi:radical SAM superfamily enzyme YgiQ (UPF0313 family)
MVGKKVRHRSPALVVDEIESILSYGMTRINVADDLFTANKERVKKVCEEIQRRGLKFSWSAFARVNTVDRETLEIMRNTGCDSVSFGIESGNQEMLDRIQKKITLDEARRAVKICKEVGILAHASFMVGLPGESTQSLRDSQKFADSLDIPYGYHFLAPFPGTTVREKIDEYDLEILTDDWDQYDANRAIVKTSKLMPEQIAEFVAEYDNEINEEWKNLVRQYKTGANTPEEDLQVAGHFRMKQVYQLLSEDIVERFGSIDMTTGRNTDKALDLLCQKINPVMGNDYDSVRNILINFIDLGYIKFRQIENACIWYWTHNKKVDF